MHKHKHCDSHLIAQRMQKMFRNNDVRASHNHMKIMGAKVKRNKENREKNLINEAKKR